MSDLKPCPFCGGALETRIDSTFNIHYAVHVPDNVDCPLSNDGYLWANPLMREMNKEDLINKLNTRPIEDALQKRIDELEEELDCMHKRFRKPTHGSCCTCQRCGQYYEHCRCSLDDAADEIVELRTKIADLESENKALRLIAGSHSMSELRRNRIMAGDKWFKYPPAEIRPEQNEGSK